MDHRAAELEAAVVEVGKKMKRIGIAIVGGIVLVIGVIAIPYPGPGWLIVFTGLAILSTEFDWAKRVLHFARGKYDAWEEWLKKQHFGVKIIFWLLTAFVVVVTLWLLNAYGIMNDVLRLPFDWVRSPLPIFH